MVMVGCVLFLTPTCLLNADVGEALGALVSRFHLSTHHLLRIRHAPLTMIAGTYPSHKCNEWAEVANVILLLLENCNVLKMLESGYSM